MSCPRTELLSLFKWGLAYSVVEFLGYLTLLKLTSTLVENTPWGYMEDKMSGCCCCEQEDGKRTNRSEEQKKLLLNRLRRIEGQVRGIQTMIENDCYCNDVLVQSAAVSAALNAFSREVLSAHIHGCVVRDIKEGKEEVIDELMQTLQKFMR